MKISIISLFPEMFSALNYGIVGRALQRKLVELSYFNPRDFAHDRYRTVDDRPYGGGPGMVMKVPPLAEAITVARKVCSAGPVIYVSPQGKLFNHAAAMQLAQQQDFILLNGRYEGIDERLIATMVDEEWSIGDYVLSGGELASMVIIDSVVRCLPGVVGHQASVAQDSFSQDRLDYPHYTRPAAVEGLSVPALLNSGDHAAITRWRLKQAVGRTWQRRPDLLSKRPLTAYEEILLHEFIEEEHKDMKL